jgi:ribonuclease R
VLVGTLKISRPGLAEVKTAEGTFPVAKGAVREAMNGDTVGVTLGRPIRGVRECYVKTVMERAVTTFLGVYDVLDPLGVVVPLDERIRRDFFVLPDDRSVAKLRVGPGDVVVARILEYPRRGEAGIVTLDKRVGNEDEVDVAIETVIASFDLPVGFSERALAQAKTITVDCEAALREEKLREDVRDLLTVTIDPATAKDFDDAISVERTEHGGYRLGVHIADVTSYVAWDDSIDIEAKARTTSVYLADRVIPMLPEELCNEACSLKPGEDRLAMSVFMTCDKAGHVLDTHMAPTVIHSNARFAYEQVDAYLAGELDEKDLSVNADEARAIGEMLRAADELAKKRVKLRGERGAIDFDSEESKVLLDEKGKPVGVAVRQKTAATSLIEESMLLANESVAKVLADHDIQTAYRVHEQPSPDTLAPTVALLKELGIVDGAQADRIVSGDPFAIEACLESVKGTTYDLLVSTLLLRSMKKAIYLPHNEGHYALGAKAYCHFTSPIRRYPDVLVHRALKEYLAGEPGGRERRECEEQLSTLCSLCSEKERAAASAEMQSQKIKMAELYSGKIGETASAVVSGCERFGLFVRVDDTGAEGLVPVRALGDEWFTFDEARCRLVGEESGTVWRLGQRVPVVVTRTDPAKGRIDFAIATGKEKRGQGKA